MYLWRRSSSQPWWVRNEIRLRALADDQLAIIERPNRKRFQLEVASKSRARLQPLSKQFGGQIRKLPRDWLKRSLRHRTKPIKIGNRKLIIPAGAAFGTGKHATTAMSLRLLEKVARSRKSGWSAIDLGTGSGILALVAKVLGAKRVIGIDNDPAAISTAKQNARLNKIGGIKFRLADVRKPQFRKCDIATANLFSELVVEILPKLGVARWLILSGILRAQERYLKRALARNGFDIIEVRRRGKWVAMVAASR